MNKIYLIGLTLLLINPIFALTEKTIKKLDSHCSNNKETAIFIDEPHLFSENNAMQRWGIWTGIESSDNRPVLVQAINKLDHKQIYYLIKNNIVSCNIRYHDGHTPLDHAHIQAEFDPKNKDKNKIYQLILGCTKDTITLDTIYKKLYGKNKNHE